ncbi:NAD-dependent epimerase/dehydratase family protein [Eisenibacter elegans]|jgi:CDP-paratose 2-epimerase|uniref:NAD-dependent epimerase/dehydratase family protein n=1 Tax=Eisenibacter elegans TaxID=997 RepID=UPI0004026A81|nr:NAD-dependent epimerase/dehydratase family protein [Eisenibacter elegans]
MHTIPKTILITGGAGFVGSSLAINLKQKYPHYEVIAFDNLKRRGSELNLPRLAEAGIQFVHGDIRQKADFDSLPAQVNTIIEASAEPSVLAGLDGTPDYLVDTNLNGTINCLYFAKKTGADFIFLSTSRVYPIENIEKSLFEEAETRFVLQDQQSLPGISAKGIAEDFPLGGYRSLYGATKLASELMIQEFQQFYGLRTVINRCGVLTGPWQMGKVDQGVVVLWMARHFWQGKLGYFGYGGQGKQVRDMLHTDDLFGLIDWQMHHLDQINGEVFNVGGGVETSASLQELTRICEEITGNRIEIQQVPENRVADIRIYLTDNSKVSAATGWTPQKRVPEIMQEIYAWMKTHQDALKKILS